MARTDPQEVKYLPSRIKPLLLTLAVTGALAGGGAAIASAATSSSTPSSSATSMSAHHSAAPRPGEMPGGNARPGSNHNCPNM